MTHPDLPLPETRSDDAETWAPIDVLIRSGLQRAFPLPTEDEAGDEGFRRLLDALARQQAIARA